VVKIFVFLDLEQTNSFMDGHNLDFLGLALIGAYGKGLAIQVNIEYEDDVNVQRLTVDDGIDWGFKIIVKYG